MIPSICSSILVTGAISVGLTGIVLLAIAISIVVVIAARRARVVAPTVPAAVEAAPALSPAPLVPGPLAPPPAAPAPVAAVRDPGPSPEVLAIIAAAVRMTFGSAARVSQVLPIKTANPFVEPLMQHWSMEGRRQIYSSHQIR